MRMLKVIGANVIVLIAILLAVEGCVRVVHPAIRPTTIDRQLLKDNVFGASRGLNPGAHGDVMGQEFSVGDDGFLAYAASVEQAQASWLFLGDSVTMGVGVAPDSTFAGRIHGALSDSIRLINASAIGYASRDYVNVLDSLSRRTDLNIQRVTVLWCLNDVYSDSLAALGPTGLQRLIPAVSQFVYRHVRSYQWLKALLTDRPRAYYEYDSAFYDRSNRFFRTAMYNLSLLKAIANRIQADLEVVALPYEYQVRTNSFAPQDIVGQWLDRQGIRFHDASNALRGTWSQNYYLYGDGVHLSSHGHRRVGRYILEIVRPTTSPASTTMAE